MKIERVELIHIQLPFLHFFETSFGREEKKSCLLIKVHTGGICGYGEVAADIRPLYSYETISTAYVILKELLIPMVFHAGISRPEEFAREAGRYQGHPMAKAGLELALWDLEAKRSGVPLSRLYGGTRQEVLSGVSVGIQDSLPQLQERIAHFCAEGYPRVKVKIKPGWDLEVCRAVRKAFPEIRLQVDANAAYTLKDREILQALDEFRLEMLEQPFSGDDLWDHSILQKEIATPICLDESAKSAEMVRRAYEMASCRIVNIKVGRVGGIVEARRIHDDCGRIGFPVWCGGMLETGIGRAHNVHLASLPHFSLPNDLSASRRYFARDIIDPEFEITPQGTLRVPEGPGIGVEPIDDSIDRAAIYRESLTP